MTNSGSVAGWAAIVALAYAAAAQGASRPAVVELFTSQGCSSCPPADGLLGELAGRSEVLALAFHVDYWDELGWRDRFELPQSSQRQSQYARQLGLASVYTPQLLIDGKDDVLGSDRRRVEQLLAAPRSGIPVSATVQGDNLVVAVGAAARTPGGEVTLVSYLPEAVTAIGRGENSGRALREFNIVRSFLPLGSWRGAAITWRVKISSLPAEARFVAVLVQESGPGAIIGALKLALPR